MGSVNDYNFSQKAYFISFLFLWVMVPLAHPKLQRFKNSRRLCSPWAVNKKLLVIRPGVWQGASQGIGFILGLNSISLTIGPVVAGVLYDQFGNYTLAFILAGIPPIVGALLMCIIHKVGNSNSLDPSQEVSQVSSTTYDFKIRSATEWAQKLVGLYPAAKWETRPGVTLRVTAIY